MSLSEMLGGKQKERRFGVALTLLSLASLGLALGGLAGWFSEVAEPQRSLQTVCAQNVCDS